MPSYEISNNLRLHIESSKDDAPINHGIHQLDEICSTFQQATGSALRVSVAEQGPSNKHVVDEIELLVNNPSKQSVQDHAAAIQSLVAELLRTRDALWRREAELAAGVPVVQHPDEQAHLAQRIEAVLQAGAEAVGAQAAALYMLNDATSELKLRAGWGLDQSCYTEAARPLRGALADLESMLGHAVVLREPSQWSTWEAPLDFASAICVPISTATTLLGTLWVFGAEPRDFSDHDTNIVEIIGGRIAADLEREMLLSQHVDSRSIDRQLRQAAAWQQTKLPKIKPMLDDWSLAGWSESGECLSGQFYDWNINSDSRLAVMLGDASGKPIEGALNSASLHSTSKASMETTVRAEQLIDRTNELFWAASTGDQFASMFYGLVDTESGELEFSSAGEMGMIVLTPDAWTIRSNSSPRLGSDPDVRYGRAKISLGRNETVIVFSEAVREVFDRDDPANADEQIAGLLYKYYNESAESLIEEFQKAIQSQENARLSSDRTILVMKRR